MRKLYHFSICPFSRKVRLALAEKMQEVELVLERFWDRRPEFLSQNPLAQVPVLVDKVPKDATGSNEFTIADSNAICEYLDDQYPERPLMGETPRAKAEVRRLVGWFEGKLYSDVTVPILSEKIFKRLTRQGSPEPLRIRQAHDAIHFHMEYIGWLSEQRNWLAGDAFSIADIAAAAQLSSLDYFGDVPWEHHPAAKEWYARIKSRPSFRPLLTDRVGGMSPPSYYANLDF
ncbi:MAG: glutathione S-transferase family protein [Alphaproteobacteria bacterium]|jgi:glutathione S-transferase|nr:glutathione S-transferase family protein [Alphaproteobacteria bacterium]MBT5389161.1 glutathione S-transferase family protein [Alphaproteobacteria bacterium]MBT5540208.1 glutathione S-transferase family protein [Alphaproteobacteria bacterium]